DLDERILNAKSLMLRTVGFSSCQAHESERESTEDVERVHTARCSEQLVEQSEVLQHPLPEDRLMITAARYQLDTGKVEVLSF
ncbi:MAG: carbonic anhydrase, partial [Bifidobacterium sp.]|nr:carbonic anhydrase [Bifidobacterium sp.]